MQGVTANTEFDYLSLSCADVNHVLINLSYWSERRFCKTAHPDPSGAKNRSKNATQNVVIASW